MSPQEQSSVSDDESQYVFVIRHGDRWDYMHPEWLETASRKGDPPLSTLGHQQARETGIFLDSLLAHEGFTADSIIWLASPFLRTLQTSDDALNAFTKIDSSNISILPEYSVFEMDGHNGRLHKDLPTMEERKHYFPRLDESYASLFVPALPESRQGFIQRCDRVANAFNLRYAYSPRTAIVVVTHAAACVALSKSLANATLEDVNAAGPCSIFRLARTSDTPVWNLDHCDKKNGFNGFMGHISEKGSTTVPWNHFGDKKVNGGYTGPKGRDPKMQEL